MLVAVIVGRSEVDASSDVIVDEKLFGETVTSMSVADEVVESIVLIFALFVPQLDVKMLHVIATKKISRNLCFFIYTLSLVVDCDIDKVEHVICHPFTHVHC